MILNSQIWQATIETAKTKSANNAYILRAIDRAVTEIERAAYWSFSDGVLTIKSTTSGKLYKVGDEHKCEAHQKYAVCKHQVARRLMQRYLEALQVAAVEAETKRAENVEHERITVSDAQGVKAIHGEIRRAPSMLDEASRATMGARPLRGEMHNGMDV
jgi:hypothetical protein